MKLQPASPLAFAGLLLAIQGQASGAAAPPSAQPDAPDTSWLALHGQVTYVEQETNGFHAPYRGPNSLSGRTGRETSDATLYVGVQPWKGAELWINAELDQGFGLDDTLGLAGFSSGEAYKVGRNKPYLRLPRAFLRDTVSLGGERQSLAAGPNQFAGSQSADRAVIWLGKFSVTDVFDTNRYAHDPRGDFFNWAVIDAGSFDYAADAWGYTVGAAVEWYQGTWTRRAGLFVLSDVPNSPHLEPGLHEYEIDLELEHRHEIASRAGKLALTVFENRGRMARLEDATAQAAVFGSGIDLRAVRRYRKRNGISANLEQQVTTDLGVFARVGDAGGNVETYEFTDIDRSAAAGVSLSGARWHRSEDTAGVAAVVSEISTARRRYLAAGGLGVLVGDGQLPRSGPEHILEGYYRLILNPMLQVSFDYQWCRNPAYNSDRGPVSVFALRIHAQL